MFKNKRMVQTFFLALSIIIVGLVNPFNVPPVSVAVTCFLIFATGALWIWRTQPRNPDGTFGKK